MEKEPLLKKWLNDELSKEEQIAFEQSKDFTFYKSIIDEAQRFKAKPHLKESSFPEIENRIETLSQQEDYTLSKKPWLKYISGIAASIIVLFGLYTYINAEKTIINTKIAETESIILPDNSKVNLNADSQLSFNKKNWKKNRKITLNGEAFFDVEKGSKFDVISSDGLVSVLGTEFNIKQRDHSFEVICFEGKVQVTTKNDKVILLAGDGVILRNGKLQEIKTSSSNPTWINGLSTFYNTPILEVLEEVERQFNTTIIVKGLDKKLEFSGGFSNNNLDDALKAITSPLGINFKIKKDQKEVIIYIEDSKR